MVISSIFRAYDIRGIYPRELNEESARRIASAYLELFPHVQKLVLARDTRLNSQSLAKVIGEVWLKGGRDVLDLDVSPDPLFYFAIFHEQYDGGIMVSGSHNPPEYGGLTLCVRRLGQKEGEDVVQEELEKIRELAEKAKEKTGSAPGKLIKADLSQAYSDYVLDRVHLKRPLKIVFDSSNGAVGYLPERIFRSLGCQTRTIYGEFDGTFPYHLPDPYLAQNRKDIEKAVRDFGADIGFMYDADGDRVALLDSQGNMVSGDDCLLLLARQALKKKKGAVVHDARVSKSFLDEMEKEGAKTYFSVSHHNAVARKIRETGAVFGGEVTLHFLFPLDYYLCDDAVFASLKLAEVVSETNDLVGLVKGLARYQTSPEVFIDSTDQEKFGLISRLQEYLKQNHYEFVDVDGARINFPHGWALARAANTTPIIKCRFEGDTKERLQEIEREALDIFQKVGIPVTQKTYQELGLRWG